MVTTLFRIIKYGVQSFWRSRLISAATILVMVLALMVLEGLIIFRVLTTTAIASLEDKIDISVYFKTSAGEDEILKIKNSLESLAEVKTVEYVSRDRALEIFKERHGDNPKISQAIEELDDNPLLASINIKADNPNNYENIASYLDNTNFEALIEHVTFTQSRLAIERLAKIVGTAENMGLALTVFLALTAILVTFNTVRLAIYSNREEIGIMRLVGASNAFVSGPYIVESVIFGFLATILSLLITAPLINLAAPNIQSFIPEIDVEGYFYANILGLFGYQLLFGSVLGVVSGGIAIRKYLKI